MDSTQRQLAKKIIDLLYRRRILIIVLLLLSLPVGLANYLRTPKTYQATSLLTYQQQKISPNRLSPDVSSGINDIVSTLTQIVTSRTNLEKLIVSLDLYPELRGELPMEDVIEALRKKIEIKPLRGGTIFTISYSGSDPDKVVKVANAIAAKFIEENMIYRQERATEISSYSSEELQIAKKVMDKQENAMRDYKLKNYNEMPDQAVINMSALASLQSQYQSKQESIQDLSKTLVLIQDQIDNRKEIGNSGLNSLGGFDFDFDLNESDQMAVEENGKLGEMKTVLDSLLLRYTENHPDVKRVRNIIAKLEKDSANKEKDLDMESDTSELSRDTSEFEGFADIQIDNLASDLETQRKNIEANIADLQQEKEQLKDKIKQYEQWIAAAPVREAEWSSLTREYGQLKRHYDFLVARDLEAGSMLNLERQQKGSQFRIEDPARYPTKPIKPNFLLIIGMSAAVGLGVGVGLTLAFDFFDSSFRDPETLEAAIGISMLTTIPYVETDEEQKSDRRKQFIIIIILTVAAAAVGIMFLAAWMRGYIVI